MGTRQNEWAQKNGKQYNLRFFPSEKYMVDFLEAQKHPYSFIKMLIKQAAERNGYAKRN